MDLAQAIKQSDDEMLPEIITRAESLLMSQLTSALAADQRAVAFAGLLTPALAVIGSAGVALLIGVDKYPGLSLACLVVFLSLFIAMFLSLKSAAPTKFYMLGLEPSLWIKDIEKQATLRQSREDLAHHYDSMIKDNQVILDRNGGLMRYAFRASWGGLALAMVIAAFDLIPLFIQVFEPFAKLNAV